jgi:hypothetical protein
MSGCSSNVKLRISQLQSPYKVESFEGTAPTPLESSELEENVDLSGRHPAALLLRAYYSS